MVINGVHRSETTNVRRVALALRLSMILLLLYNYNDYYYYYYDTTVIIIIVMIIAVTVICRTASNSQMSDFCGARSRVQPYSDANAIASRFNGFGGPVVRLPIRFNSFNNRYQ